MKTRIFIVLFIVIAALSSCKTQYVPYEVERIKYDSIYRSVHTRDTLISRDTLKVTIKGDCVDSVITRWRESIKYRTDTFYINRVDSFYVELPIPYVPDGYVKKYWFNYALEGLGVLASIAILVLIIIGLIKLKKKFL